MSVKKQKTFISGVSFFCCFSILECSADQREMLICSCSHYRKKKESLIKVWRGHQHITAHQNFLKFTKRVEILKGDALWFSKFELCTVCVTCTQFSFFHLGHFFWPVRVDGRSWGWYNLPGLCPCWHQAVPWPWGVRLETVLGCEALLTRKQK